MTYTGCFLLFSNSSCFSFSCLSTKVFRDFSKRQTAFASAIESFSIVLLEREIFNFFSTFSPRQYTHGFTHSITVLYSIVWNYFSVQCFPIGDFVRQRASRRIVVKIDQFRPIKFQYFRDHSCTIALLNQPLLMIMFLKRQNETWFAFLLASEKSLLMLRLGRVNSKELIQWITALMFVWLQSFKESCNDRGKFVDWFSKFELPLLEVIFFLYVNK